MFILFCNFFLNNYLIVNYILEKIEVFFDIYDFRFLILRLELSNIMSGFFFFGFELKFLFYGKIEVKLEVILVDFGFFNVIEGEYYKNFFGGYYWVIMLKGECLVFY